MCLELPQKVPPIRNQNGTSGVFILSKIYCTLWNLNKPYIIFRLAPELFLVNQYSLVSVYKIQDVETGMTNLVTILKFQQTVKGSYSRTERTSSHVVKENLILVEPRPMAELDAGSGQTTALSMCAFTGESAWKDLTRVVGT